MPNYSCLSQNIFTYGKYSLVPIRSEDRYEIMRWRNEQIYHLRQKEILTEVQQDKYFDEVVSKLFNQERPSQILFSFLENGGCIGYGGFVHTDWNSRHAEISILLDTELNKSNYKKLALVFLHIVEHVGFDLKLNKIYTYGYDFDDARFEPLYKSGFILDAFLHEHVLVNEKLVPVRIYSKILKK